MAALVVGLLYPFAAVATGRLDERFPARGAMAVLAVVLAAVLALTFLPGLRPPPPDAEPGPDGRSTSLRRCDHDGAAGPEPAA
ncbi:hypothetical protein [Kitasatospora sp. NPDC088346]|uniref:hypothetical protein n=1 Tax=Kitasatospora sp. NPDC088346 TaxID=3364073 RepID=UPI0037F6DF4C